MFQNLEIVINMRGEIMNYKPLVYVAHPCGSDIKANRKECRNIISMLTKTLGDKYIFISPVLNYSHMYHDVDYISGLETCLSLLQRCSFLLLAGDWKNSKGCLCEYGAARSMGMAVSELTKYVALYGNDLTLSINCLHKSVHGQKLETDTFGNPPVTGTIANEGAFAHGSCIEKPLTVANQND